MEMMNSTNVTEASNNYTYTDMGSSVNITGGFGVLTGNATAPNLTTPTNVPIPAEAHPPSNNHIIDQPRPKPSPSSPGSSVGQSGTTGPNAPGSPGTGRGGGPNSATGSVGATGPYVSQGGASPNSAAGGGTGTPGGNGVAVVAGTGGPNSVGNQNPYPLQPQVQAGVITTMIASTNAANSNPVLVTPTVDSVTAQAASTTVVSPPPPPPSPPVSASLSASVSPSASTAPSSAAVSPTASPTQGVPQSDAVPMQAWSMFGHKHQASASSSSTASQGSPNTQSGFLSGNVVIPMEATQNTASIVVAAASASPSAAPSNTPVTAQTDMVGTPTGNQSISAASGSEKVWINFGNFAPTTNSEAASSTIATSVSEASVQSSPTISAPSSSPTKGVNGEFFSLGSLTAASNSGIPVATEISTSSPTSSPSHLSAEKVWINAGNLPQSTSSPALSTMSLSNEVIPALQAGPLNASTMTAMGAESANSFVQAEAATTTESMSISTQQSATEPSQSPTQSPSKGKVWIQTVNIAQTSNGAVANQENSMYTASPPYGTTLNTAAPTVTPSSSPTMSPTGRVWVHFGSLVSAAPTYLAATNAPSSAPSIKVVSNPTSVGAVSAYPEGGMVYSEQGGPSPGAPPGPSSGSPTNNGSFKGSSSTSAAAPQNNTNKVWIHFGNISTADMTSSTVEGVQNETKQTGKGKSNPHI